MADIITGDCLEVLRGIDSCSIDACVTDPPAGIAFMGKAWDGSKGGRDQWISWLASVMAEVLRVLRPGGHAVVWALPRTSHWTGMALETAGFEVRDCLTHLFGSGFPKSLDVSKAIDKAAGADRQQVGSYTIGGNAGVSCKDKGGTYGVGVGTAPPIDVAITAPSTEDAKRWDGWGTALKPAAEMWWLCRKPLGGTVAANVLEHGTGALNVDGCRVGHSDPLVTAERTAPRYSGATMNGGKRGGVQSAVASADPAGRWPPNVLLTHDPNCGAQCVDACPVRMLDEQSGDRPVGSVPAVTGARAVLGGLAGYQSEPRSMGDSGGASRFFPRFRYSPKPSTAEREAGLGDVARVDPSKVTGRKPGSNGQDNPRSGMRGGERRNIHPTVKSIDLMRWLCRLITPPGGLVVDPFCGSGTTGMACKIEGFRFVGIEQSAQYADIAGRRIAACRFGKAEPLASPKVKADQRQMGLFDD